MSTDGEHHAILAPSSAGVWGPGGCPGSIQMQAKQSPPEPTDEDREGTAAHWLLAQTLLKLTVPADAVAPNGVPINNEMREAIRDMVTDVNDTLKNCQSGDFYQIEQRVFAHQMIHPENDGTPDAYAVFWSRKTVHLWDFKYGHRFVDVFRCMQLVNYAAGVVETEKITDWQDWTFTFTIAQPRCFARDELGGPLREWYTTGKYLAPLFDELRAAAALAMQPNAPLKTGDYCRDCTAAWDCEANQRVGGYCVDLAHGQQSVGMDPLAIGLELKTLEEAAARLKARINNLEVKALQIFDEGGNVPYCRVGFSDTRTLWDKTKIDEAASIVAMFTEGVVRPGVALPTPREVIKMGIDETVIKPYSTKANGAKKLLRVNDTNAAKVFGVR